MNKLKTVEIGSRGQIVIPKEFRDDLKLKDGETIVIFENQNSLVIKKQTAVIKILKKFDVKEHELASVETLNKIWENEPDELWESYL